MIFQVSRELALECYRVTKSFPSEEKFVMVQQIRKSALSVHLNIAEGSSRKSPTERKRFYEIGRGSVVEIDTAFDLAFALGYCSPNQTKNLEDLVINAFKQLSSLIGYNY